MPALLLPLLAAKATLVGVAVAAAVGASAAATGILPTPLSLVSSGADIAVEEPADGVTPDEQLAPAGTPTTGDGDEPVSADPDAADPDAADPDAEPVEAEPDVTEPVEAEPDVTEPVEAEEPVTPQKPAPVAPTDVTLPDCPEGGTHGQYVASVARDRSATGAAHGARVSAAARSDCGKPVEAVEAVEAGTAESPDVLPEQPAERSAAESEKKKKESKQPAEKSPNGAKPGNGAAGSGEGGNKGKG